MILSGAADAAPSAMGPNQVVLLQLCNPLFAGVTAALWRVLAKP